MKLAAVAAAFILAGCGHQVQIPREVLIEVPVPCIKTAPTKPKLNTDEALRKASDGDHVSMLAADRLALRGYARQLESAMAGCSSLPK